jgi:hypothetical protein
LIKQSFQKNAFDLEYRRYKILSRLLQFKERKDCFVVVTSINEFELIRVADKKKISCQTLGPASKRVLPDLLFF